MRETTVQRTPTRTYCERNRPLPYCTLNKQDVPALKIYPAPSPHPTTPSNNRTQMHCCTSLSCVTFFPLLLCQFQCSVNVKIPPDFYDKKDIKNTIHGIRRLRTAILADSEMKLPLRETSIAKVKKGDYYRITNLVSSIFSGSIQLNTIASTSFTEIAPFENVYTDMRTLNQTEDITGTVTAARLVRQLKCISCTNSCLVTMLGNVW